MKQSPLLVPSEATAVPTKDSYRALLNIDQVKNGFADSTGMHQFNPFGFPENQSFPGSAPVEQVSTVFKNMRWYLVSNMRQVLNQCYVELGLVKIICDVPVDDGFRGGIEINSKQLDESQIEQLQISIDRDNDLNSVKQAQKWNRLFGGAGVLILTDQDPEEPLDIASIGTDTPLEFRPVDMWELFWNAQNTEGYDPSLQVENFEHYNYYGERIHKSRVMRLKGLEAPSFIRPRLRGWGFSVVEILVRSLNQYLKSTDLAFEVLDEFKIDVYKIRGLVNTLMSPQGFEKVFRQVQLTNYQKNFQNALVIDKEDEWDHKQLSFAGLAEMMQQIRMQVAADMCMPITKLFGTSTSGGLGNTDQNDMENYNSMVESQVRDKAKYDILRICEIKCQKLFGFIPDDLSISFKPLRVLSAEQEENVKNAQFNRLHMAVESGRISNFEYREAINKANLLPISLDNAGEALNPNDPEIRDIVKEGAQDPYESLQDIDDPGTNRRDTPKVRSDEFGGAPKGQEKAQVRKNNFTQKLKRFFKGKNSDIFDRKSYEADGGDSMYPPNRLTIFRENLPSWIDQSIWKTAKERSKDAYPGGNLGFTVWMYEKLSGKKI